MIMRWLLIAAGSIAAVLLALPAFADPILRPAVVVTGDQIRLGDLFDGVGDKASEPVAHAPAPGRREVVDADWLQHVAAMNGLDWKTDDPFLQVVIKRAGVTITREMTAANAGTKPATVEIRQPQTGRGFAVISESATHGLKSGDPVWRLAVAPGQTATLTYAYSTQR